MTRSMIAYLIDPFAQRVSQVIHTGDYRHIYTLIGNGCHCFTAVGLWHRGDTVYVDDNGLFVPNLRSFGLQGYPEPLFGRGVVLGSDDEGESTAPRISLDELKRRVAWLPYVTRGEPAWAEDGEQR